MVKVINELFPHLNEELSNHVKKVYPDFKILCSVIKYRSPRHSYFEFLLDIGRVDIDKLFSKESFRKNELIFIFPERWMSVHEQHKFANELCNHPDAKKGKINTILIVTSSPLIVGNFYGEQLRILY